MVDRGGRRARAAAAADGHAEADVVVIGGGYLGMWTAWHLLEREPETRVVLLERDRCGHGPSGRNGGFVNGYWGHAPDVAAQFGAAAAVRLAQEADASVRAIGEFCKTREDRRLVPRGAAGRDRDRGRAGRLLARGDRGPAARWATATSSSELAPAQVQAICRSPVFRGGAVAAHRGDGPARAPGVRPARARCCGAA